MATVNLMDVLGAPQLCGTIQGTKTGVPDVFPAGFTDPILNEKPVEKDTGSYFRVTGTRTTAKAVAYGSPSVARQLKGVEEVPVKLMHTKENIGLPLSDFRNLIDPDRSSGADIMVDSDKVTEIGRQVREARQNIDNLRISALTSALFNGAIWWDAQGNLLPSSSGAKSTADFAIPAGNKTQLNWDGNGNIIDTSWDNAAAPIDKQMIALKVAARRLTGYMPKYAFYGKNVPGYLTSNTKLSAYFVRNQVSNGQYLGTGDIPNPLLGLTWAPAYEAFYEDQNGAFQSLIDDDTVVFTPEPTRDWLGWLRGTMDVPQSLTIGDDAVAALRNFKAVVGQFAYATIQTDSPGIKMVYGDTFLPSIKVPKVLFIAKVRF